MVVRAIVVILALEIAAGTAVVAAQDDTCTEGISRETTERLFAVLNHPPREADCKFEGIQTNRTTLDAAWSRAGQPLPPLRISPRQCAPGEMRHVGPFAIEVPPEIAQSCPSVAALIEEFLTATQGETPTAGSGGGDAFLYRIAQLIFAAIFASATIVLAAILARVRHVDTRWLALGLAGFGGALLLRALLPFSLGNWYAEVLPATGPPPWMRFGPGSFAFQSLLRTLGLWNTQGLTISQLIVGASAVPLLLGVLRELRIGLAAAAASVIVLLFAPLHARLSATSSEHVLASTLCLALLFSWLRANRTKKSLWLTLTILLFPAVCLTRVDMTAQAMLVLAWPFLRDQGERKVSVGRPWRATELSALALTVVLTGTAVYGGIALPSHHPMPERAGQITALRDSIGQFWHLATSDPGWVTLPAVSLAAIGALAMVRQRPFLLLRIAVTLVASFGLLGRTLMFDQLLGARYFLFPIALFCIASGEGFAALLAPIPKRVRRPIALAGLGLLAIWNGIAAREAYAIRYAFQDEYTFLREALTGLPDGCLVYQVPIRSDSLARDLDCCLDLRRSPLVLDFSRLRFRDLPNELNVVWEDGNCVAYYESVACQIRDDPSNPAVHSRAESAAPYFARRCGEVHQLGRLERLASTTTSPRATVDFFYGQPPPATLYRWTNP